MTEQRIAGVGVHVTDLERSVDFYTSVLGMHVVGRFEFEGITEVLVGYGELGSAPNVVLVDRAANPGPHDLGNGFDRILVIVDDIDATCKRVQAFGCAITAEPDVALEMPVKIVMAQDPDGYGLELIEPADSPTTS